MLESVLEKKSTKDLGKKILNWWGAYFTWVKKYDLEKFSTDLIISFLLWKNDFAKNQRLCCNLDFFLLRLYYLLEYNVRNPLLHHQRTDLCLMRKSFGFRCVKSYVSQWNNSQGTNMTSNSETHCWSNFVSECVCQPCQ